MHSLLALFLLSNMLYDAFHMTRHQQILRTAEYDRIP